jgi:Bacterial Ig-like domain (group 3)
LGTASIDGAGHASFTTSALALGSHEVTALYPGDADNDPVSSAPLSVVVVPRGTASADHLARVKRGRALVKLRCRGNGPCEGVAKLFSRTKTKRVVSRHDRRRVVRRSRQVLIGKARFRIAAGKAEVVRVQLSRTGRKLLRRARRHRLKVKLQGQGVRSRTVLLKQAQRKR